MAEIDSGVIRNARHNAAIAWIRLPISAIVSGFLFIFIDTGIGWAWLAAILAIEVFAWYVRSRLLAGDVRFQLPHLIALSLVSIAWVVLVLLLWQSRAEVARIASVMTLFSLAFYGVARHKSAFLSSELRFIAPFRDGDAWTRDLDDDNPGCSGMDVPV
jgi:hypothetical protein